MDYNEETRTFITWAAPTGLILTPALLGVVIFRVVQDKMAGLPVNLFDLNFLFIVTFCVVGFLVSLFYCKKELGWFQKRPDKSK